MFQPVLLKEKIASVTSAAYPYLSSWLTRDTAHYRLIVTLCGANSGHSILMRPRRIVNGDIRLGPQKVTMNHIIVQEIRQFLI